MFKVKYVDSIIMLVRLDLNLIVSLFQHKCEVSETVSTTSLEASIPRNGPVKPLSYFSKYNLNHTPLQRVLNLALQQNFLIMSWTYLWMKAVSSWSEGTGFPYYRHWATSSDGDVTTDTPGQTHCGWNRCGCGWSLSYSVWNQSGYGRSRLKRSSTLCQNLLGEQVRNKNTKKSCFFLWQAHPVKSPGRSINQHNNQCIFITKPYFVVLFNFDLLTLAETLGFVIQNK